MKKISFQVFDAINKYTSGVPFVIWSTGGLAVAIFVIIFRQHSDFQFDKLKYIIMLAPIWFIVSDILKKQQLLNKSVHFAIDSVLYITILTSFVYYTGAYNSDLSFIFFFGVISAPLFGSTIEVIVFALALSAATFFVHFADGHIPDGYEMATAVLQSFFYFLISGVIRFSLELVRIADSEKHEALENVAKELEIKVTERTQELAKANVELKNKMDELKKTVGLMVDREVQVAEMKRSFAAESSKLK